MNELFLLRNRKSTLLKERDMSMVVTLAQAKRSEAVFDSSAVMAKEKIA